MRPRTDWEAIDLGTVLVRTEWRSVYSLWTLVMLPVLGLSVVLLGGWGLILTWWLLPLGEMAILLHLSRAVFGAAPTLKECLRELPSLWRRGLPELFVRRPNPMRCANLPVGQLERLTGSDRQARVAVLGSVGQGAPALLPTAFVLFELGFAASLILLAHWMVPDGLGFDFALAWERFFEGALPPTAYRVTWWFLGAVVLLFHPLHVAAGFALYLDRRTVLEGWDLDIAFRRMRRRLERSTAGATVAILLAVLLTVGGFAASDVSARDIEGDGESVAGDVEPAPPSPRATWVGEAESDPRRVAREVLSRPSFQREVQERRWQLREDLFDDGSREQADLSWMAGLGGILAMLVEPVLWLAAVVVLILILRALWHRLPEGPTATTTRAKPPERLAGLDVRPESLPDDIPGTAESLWLEGQPAAALSLLYRGALARLGTEGLDLRESYTEDDCLRAARVALSGERTTFFAELTGAWQRTAYAHRVPSSDQASRLWRDWEHHFGRGVTP
ncbi:MAG: DUF4129 domain-containing protein [Acidobacteriota bacterium]